MGSAKAAARALLAPAVHGVPLACLLALGGCSDTEPKTIDRVRQADTARPARLAGRSEAFKFGYMPPAEAQPKREPQAPPRPPTFTYGLPEGWERLPGSQFRQINTRIADSPEAQCYLTWLPMDGGGDVANVNRWRQQLGLGPIAAAEVAAMPRVPLLGGNALRVDLSGSFRGMAGEQIEGGRLLGVLLTRAQGGALFVKFVGPADIVERESQHFDEFVASIGLSAEAQAGTTGASNATGSGASISGASALTWTVPEGWQQQAGARQMREVTLTKGGAEMYISILGGGGGGILANVNRWYGQVGEPGIGQAALAGLERLPCLGGEALMVETAGTLKAMEAKAQAGSGLIGALLEQPTRMVTVKMVGPAAEVAAGRAAFVAFVGSLGDKR